MFAGQNPPLALLGEPLRARRLRDHLQALAVRGDQARGRRRRLGAAPAHRGRRLAHPPGDLLIDVRISHKLPDNNEFPAEVRLEFASGELLAERRDVPPGGSTRPLSEEEVLAKLRGCAAAVLDGAAIARIIESVQGLERLGRVESVCADLEGPRPT
ncbi:MAG TPA: hypothetical protein VLC73_16820 [Burkholderiales bacterium]|nr:hypothetical protein [Burkholderiales bacterium]